MAITKLEQLVNPQVMADMISANLPKAIKFSHIAAIDTTLEGAEGDTITVPKFAYIGDGEDLTEAVAMGTAQLTTSTTTVTVKEIGKAVEISDKAIIAGHGDPVGETTKQINMSIAAKVDNDCVDKLYDASLTYNGTASKISYDGVVDAVDVFGDENDENTAKVMYIHPAQVGTLRKDSDFKDKNKYPMNVVMDGVFGEVAGCQVIKSKKVKKVEYDVKAATASGYTEITSANLSTYAGKFGVNASNKVVELAVGQFVKALDNAYFVNPIVVVDTYDPSQDVNADDFARTQAALTIYMKRRVMVETDRDILKRTNVISANQHYGVALSNDSKVVLASYKA